MALAMTSEMHRSVRAVAQNGLCASCGLCAAACPADALVFSKVGGSMVPNVQDTCMEYGLCLAVCPGIGGSLDGISGTLCERMVGSVQEAASAHALDRRVFEGAVSGGVATQLVGGLLNSGDYDSAFLVDRACVKDDACHAVRFSRGDDVTTAQGSKYLQVSHENTLRYMRAHPNEKIVVACVPCAARGLLKAIEVFRLNRENYLFIGLFCDKTMTSNVLLYFQDIANGADVEELVFRSKQVGGWPGGVRLVMGDGARVDFDRSTRMRVKRLFQPECCLYCLDKLNVCADIALGDDYTGRGKRCGGACSVIVRTSTGIEAWRAISSGLKVEAVDVDEIAASQHLERQADNLLFGQLKQKDLEGSFLQGTINDVSGFNASSEVVSQDIQRVYRERLREIGVGARYDVDPGSLRASWRKRIRLCVRLRTRHGKHFGGNENPLRTFKSG